MSSLWLVPPLVLLVGMIGTLRLLRSTDDAAGEIQRQLVELGEVHLAVAAVRAETAAARASLEQLNQR